MTGVGLLSAALVAGAVLVALPGRRRLRGLTGHQVAAHHRVGVGRQGHGPDAPDDVTPALLADLVAAMLDAGLPPSTALATLRSCLTDLHLAEPASLGELLDALRLADRAGLPPAGLVRSAAASLRRREVAHRSTAAHRLAVLVVLPMGLCLLPAFFLLTVAPFVIALLLG